MVIRFESFRHILPFTFVHLSLSGLLSLCSFSRTFTSSTNPSGNILSIGNAGDGEFCCAVFMWFITFLLPKLAPRLLINKLLRTNNINREEERSHICASNFCGYRCTVGQTVVESSVYQKRNTDSSMIGISSEPVLFSYGAGAVSRTIN